MNHYECQDSLHQKYLERLNQVNSTKNIKMFIMEKFAGNTSKRKFQCSNGHYSFVQPYSVLYGTGCAYCSGKAKKTTQSYILELRAANENKSVHLTLKPGEEYINCYTKISHICEYGHEHSVAPEKALKNTYKCPHCTKKLPYTSPLQLEKALRKLNLTFIHGEVNGGASKVTIACSKGHQFMRTVHSIVNKNYGCTICMKAGWSRKCIDWLRHISNIEGISIRHAENGGEYKLPSTNIKVDGFCAATNTVFEFHGDKFHGNLKKYKHNDYPNPFSNKTALELFEDTLRREERIKNLGYNLVAIWERDYDSEYATT